MFEDNEVTGLPVKQKKKSTQQTSSPAKRKAKPTGKRTGGRPATKPQDRGMTLETETPTGKEKTNEGVESSQDDNKPTKSSEDVAPSSKRQNSKTTPPTAEPLRKPTRIRQSALANTFGNAIPIDAVIETGKIEEKKQVRKFEIDSPPAQKESNYPSLETLIQDMGFSDKTPQYQACLKFIEAISPKQGNKKDEVIDLTSLTDEVMVDNNNDIPLIKEETNKKNATDAEMPDDEEHAK